MLILADSGTLQWLDWALNRGTQGVLMLACFVLASYVMRLHKEKNKLHEDRTNREREFQQQIEELEQDFRSKIEELLREQIRIVQETSRVLVHATEVLKSLNIVVGSEPKPPEGSKP